MPDYNAHVTKPHDRFRQLYGFLSAETSLIGKKRVLRNLRKILLQEDFFPYGLALFQDNGTLIQANPSFYRLCTGNFPSSTKRIQLFTDFTFYPEIPSKIDLDHFTSLLARYTPSVPTDGGHHMHHSPYMETAFIPFKDLDLILLLLQPLSDIKHSIMHINNKWVHQFITENLNDIIILHDSACRILYVNESVHRMLGYSQQSLVNTDVIGLFHSDEQDRVRQVYRHALEGESDQVIEARMQTLHGHYLWIESRVRAFAHGNLHTILTVNRDITQHKQTEEQIKFMTFHDSLTGVFNRNYFEQEMSRVEEGRYREVGLIMCDIDGLKFINDTLGHKSGDQLIKSAAEVILSSFRASDLVARIGGDEFAVILPNTSQQDLQAAVQRILKNMCRFNAQGPGLPLRMSLGAAYTNRHPIDMQALFKQADEDMYRNKIHNKREHKKDAVQAILSLLEQKLPGTRERNAQLIQHVEHFSKALGLSRQKSDDLRLLAQVHNIGLLGIPTEILLKTSSLIPEERDQVHKQAENGYRIAQYIDELEPIADWILKQHEWWNGQGYPLGLQGEEIPLEARIMAIARAYTAMTKPSFDRPAMTPTQALKELKQWAGIQFDPGLVEVFVDSMSTSWA